MIKTNMETKIQGGNPMPFFEKRKKRAQVKLDEKKLE